MDFQNLHKNALLKIDFVNLKLVDCPNQEKHKIKCSTNKNDFTVYEVTALLQCVWDVTTMAGILDHSPVETVQQLYADPVVHMKTNTLSHYINYG